MNRSGTAHRATIIGGSIGGLLTAAAIHQAFDEVVIVESDELPEQPAHRAGVPQGNQVHALLAIGVRSMEQLLPGVVDDLVAAGGVMMDAGCDVAIYEAEGWAGRVKSEAHVVSMRRTHLEHVIRGRVLELQNVELRPAEVVGLLGDSARVTGVKLDGRSDGSADGRDGIESDLVIDSSGRGSRAPVWLEELGCTRPSDQELRSYVGYATVPVRLPEGAFPEGVPAILSHPNPGNHYGSSVIPVGDGLHLFGALGMMKCYPSTERQAFLEHMDKASSPLVAELARKAEFVGEIDGYRMPGTRRRVWTTVGRPDGFAAVGDSVLSINPLYGQGMSVVAVEAVAIRALTMRADVHDGRLARRIQDSIEPIVERVFQLVCSIDGRYPDAKRIGLEPMPPEMVAMARAMGELATEDAEASRAFRYAVQFFANEELMSQSLITKVMEWMGSGRSVAAEYNDPHTVPGILGVAEPATIPAFGP
jgi:2-polyprenyl-6-methoxyphenol hydroxylase-like FAD-dependent oxidoreductase